MYFNMTSIIGKCFESGLFVHIWVFSLILTQFFNRRWWGKRSNLKTEVAHVPVSKGQEMFIFREVWRALFSCYLRFTIRTFVLSPTKSKFLYFNHCTAFWYLIIDIECFNIYLLIYLIYFKIFELLNPWKNYFVN